MNTKKWTFVLGMTTACLLVVACGEDTDPRISDQEAAWLRQQAGQGTTVTQTQTQTQTQTTTVTITPTT